MEGRWLGDPDDEPPTALLESGARGTAVDGPCGGCPREESDEG